MATITLTLRDARRLDQEVEKLVARRAEEVKASETVSIFREPLHDDEIAGMQERVFERLTGVKNLTRFRFLLRSKIRVANSRQVDGLTLRLAEAEAEQALITGVVTVVDDDPYALSRARRRGRQLMVRVRSVPGITAEQINAQLQTMRSAAAQAQGPQELEVKFLTPDMVSRVDVETAAVKRRVMKLKDELAVANAKTVVKVEVDSLVESVLGDVRPLIGDEAIA